MLCCPVLLKKKIVENFESTEILDYWPNGPGDWGSIPGRVIPKTKKMVLDAALLNTQHYTVRIKVKWNNPGNRVAPSPLPWCSSY